MPGILQWPQKHNLRGPLKQIGHRVVHGGERLTPLHNPADLPGIRAALGSEGAWVLGG